MKMTQEPDSPADTSNSATASKPTSPLEIDDYIIAPIIQILYRGSPSDQLMAFELIRTYLGLSKPGEPEVKGKRRRKKSNARDPGAAIGLGKAGKCLFLLL